MAPWRYFRVRRLLAVVALLGALLHVALVPRHAVMQIAAASASASGVLSAAEQWAADLGIPICHGSIIVTQDDTAQNGNGKPAKALGPCLVCASVLAAVAHVDVDAGAVFAPGDFPHRYTSLQTAGSSLPRAAAFEARGPPATA